MAFTTPEDLQDLIAHLNDTAKSYTTPEASKAACRSSKRPKRLPRLWLHQRTWASIIVSMSASNPNLRLQLDDLKVVTTWTDDRIGNHTDVTSFEGPREYTNRRLSIASGSCEGDRSTGVITRL